MADLEKVIKGLEVCRDQNNPPGYRFTSCVDDCPYHGNGCARKLKEDALALIKEQESEILKFIEGVAILTAENEMLKKDNLAKSVLHEHQVNAYLNKQLANRPEIVRCKDCKYYDGNGTCMKNGIALLTDHWFCADGKRR